MLMQLMTSVLWYANVTCTWPRKISTNMFDYLWKPCIVMITQLHEAFEFHGEDFQCLDLFAGKRAVSKAYSRKKMKSCALDIAIDPRDDSYL